jgi:hypothetical protein
LAVLTSIADGKHDDPQYVIKQYFKHKEMASILQNCDESVVVEYVDNPKVVEALETLRTLFNSKVEGT